jgi:type 1 glutamine amidotransferase
MRASLLFLAVSFLWTASSAVSAEPAKPLRVLMVTGGCCHDYTNQKRILAEGLSARLPVQWTVVHDVVMVDGKDTAANREHVTSAYAKADWAAGYDLVLHNECYGAVKDEAFIERITKPHKAGLPAVFLHCSMHSYRAAANADLWREIIGVKSTFHEPGAVLTVKAAASKHPVLAGFPAVFTTPEKDELYVAEKFYDTATALATVFSEKRQVENPVVWVNEVGGLRTFSTSLGHLNSTMERPEYLDLVARGLLWACGKLDANGKPAPGYEAPAK